MKFCDYADSFAFSNLPSSRFSREAPRNLCKYNDFLRATMNFLRATTKSRVGILKRPWKISKGQGIFFNALRIFLNGPRKFLDERVYRENRVQMASHRPWSRIDRRAENHDSILYCILLFERNSNGRLDLDTPFSCLPTCARFFSTDALNQ